MKREGRQHGMVRSIQILPSPLTQSSGHWKFVNAVDSPPAAGVFVKVSRKPTNHSKFTGKCGQVRCVECHEKPVCKSKDKVKGSYKVKVSETGFDFDYSRVSATGILDHYLGDYGSDYVDYHEDDVVVEGNLSELNVGKEVDEEDEDEGWYLVTQM